jgi:hypothetical protein
MFKKVVALFCATVMIAIPTFAHESPTTIYQNAQIEGASIVQDNDHPVGGLVDTVMSLLSTNIEDASDETDRNNAFYNAVLEAVSDPDVTVVGDVDVDYLEGKSPIEQDPFSHKIERTGDDPAILSYPESMFDSTEEPAIVVVDEDGKVIGIFKLTLKDGSWTANVTIDGYFTIVA